jgi:hypothetical protein
MLSAAHSYFFMFRKNSKYLATYLFSLSVPKSRLAVELIQIHSHLFPQPNSFIGNYQDNTYHAKAAGTYSNMMRTDFLETDPLGNHRSFLLSTYKRNT